MRSPRGANKTRSRPQRSPSFHDHAGTRVVLGHHHGQGAHLAETPSAFRRRSGARARETADRRASALAFFSASTASKRGFHAGRPGGVRRTPRSRATVPPRLARSERATARDVIPRRERDASGVVAAARALPPRDLPMSCDWFPRPASSLTAAPSPPLSNSGCRYRRQGAPPRSPREHRRQAAPPGAACGASPSPPRARSGRGVRNPSLGFCLDGFRGHPAPVSYTHLTLPTILLV